MSALQFGTKWNPEFGLIEQDLEIIIFVEKCSIIPILSIELLTIKSFQYITPMFIIPKIVRVI